MTREEAIEILWRYDVNFEPHPPEEVMHAIDMAIEALKNRPQGEWKIDEYGIYHCPICHAINNTVYKSFCPNCGARMTPYKGGDGE